MEYKLKERSRFLRTILEAVSRMKNAKVIDILDVTLLEVEAQRILFGKEVKGVECFCLSFRDWGNIC